MSSSGQQAPGQEALDPHEYRPPDIDTERVSHGPGGLSQAPLCSGAPHGPALGPEPGSAGCKASSKDPTDVQRTGSQSLSAGRHSCHQMPSAEMPRSVCHVAWHI